MANLFEVEAQSPPDLAEEAMVTFYNQVFGAMAHKQGSATAVALLPEQEWLVLMQKVEALNREIADLSAKYAGSARVIATVDGPGAGSTGIAIDIVRVA